MRLTFRLSDELGQRVESAVAKAGLDSVDAFLARAIETEVERFEAGHVQIERDREIDSLTESLRRLDAGQRTIIALINSTAQIICSALTRTVPSPEKQNQVDELQNATSVLGLGKAVRIKRHKHPK